MNKDVKKNLSEKKRLRDFNKEMRTNRIQNRDPQILLQDTSHEMDKVWIISVLTEGRMGDSDKRNYILK
jgi:hypothetical protein